MKVIDINKGKKVYEKKLAEVAASLDFKCLIELIEYCLDHNFFDCKDLLKLWETRQDSFINGDCFWDYFNILGRITIKHSVDSAPPTQSRRPSDLAMALVENYIPDLERNAKFLGRYSWFFPSHYISELLEELYPDELNPGRVIATQLNLLFPQSYPETYSDHFADHASLPGPACSVPYDSPLSILVKDTSSWALSQTFQNAKLRKCYESCLQDMLGSKSSLNQADIDDLENIYISLLFASDVFFYNWIHNCLLVIDDKLTPNLNLDNYKAALVLFSFGKGNDPLIASGYGPSSLKTKYDEVTCGKSEQVKCNNFLSYNTFFLLLFVYCDAGIYPDIECNTYIKQIIANLTNYRLQYFSGIAPFNNNEAGTVDYITVSNIGVADCDFLVLLSSAGFPEGELQLILDKNEEAPSVRELLDFYNNKQKTYITLFAKASIEGNYELGTALFSLYIISQFTSGVRFGNLQELLPVIEKALSLPGAKILRHTLSIVTNNAEKYFPNDPGVKYLVRLFRQFLPQGADLLVLPGGKIQEGGKLIRSEEDAHSKLTESLGMERWNKLSKNSQECLLSAELQWKNNALDFGFDIKDWSGLIATYCKPIEGELVERLADFYVSEIYGDWLIEKGDKRPAKATAGWLLKALKGYDQMPVMVQGEVRRSRIMLHDNQKLVNELYDIVQNYRNISAHYPAVNMKRFADFKHKIFQDGVLARFIDTFA